MNKLALRQRECLVCCSTKTPLFRLPKDVDRLLVWLKILQMTYLLQHHPIKYIRETARICQIHFKNESFTSTFRQRLLKFANPICPFLPTTVSVMCDRENIMYNSFKEVNVDQSNKSFQENKELSQNLNESYSSENVHRSLEIARIEFNNAFMYQSQKPQLKTIQPIEVKEMLKDDCKTEVIKYSDTQKILNTAQHDEKYSNTQNLNVENLKELFRAVKVAIDIVSENDRLVERRVKFLHDINNVLNPYHKLFENLMQKK